MFTQSMGIIIPHDCVIHYTAQQKYLVKHRIDPLVHPLVGKAKKLFSLPPKIISSSRPFLQAGSGRSFRFLQPWRPLGSMTKQTVHPKQKAIRNIRVQSPSPPNNHAILPYLLALVSSSVKGQGWVRELLRSLPLNTLGSMMSKM